MIKELKILKRLFQIRKESMGFTKTSFKNHKDIETKSFESSYEHIFDIYNLRWQHINQQGKIIIGLENFITNLKNTKDVGHIKTTILTVNTEKIVIFTDIDYKRFLGMIYLNNAS